MSTKEDILFIFRTYWPNEGYEGVSKLLPNWTRQRAKAFASKHGIQMSEEAKVKTLTKGIHRARDKKQYIKANESALGVKCVKCNEIRPCHQYADKHATACLKCEPGEYTGNATMAKALSMRW